MAHQNIGTSCFRRLLSPFSLSSLPRFHMEGILGEAEQILPES